MMSVRPFYGRNIFSVTVLLFTLAFHLVFNWVWVSENELPLGTAEQEQLQHGEYYFSSMMGSGPFSALNGVYNSRLYFPPVFYVTSFLFGMPGGFSYQSLAMTNTLFLAVLLLSVYGIGRLCAGESAGLLSAVLLSFSPLISQLSREYSNFICFCAMFSLSVYFFIRSDMLSKSRESVLFGIVTAGSLLSDRLIGFLFLLPLFMDMVLKFVWAMFAEDVEGWREKINSVIKRNRARLVNAALVSSVAALIAGKYYFNWFMRNKEVFVSQITKGTMHVSAGKLFYVDSLLAGVHFLFFCAFFVFLPFFVFRKMKHKSLLILWLTVPLLIFAHTAQKCDYYIVAALPAFFLLLASGITSVKPAFLMAASVFLSVSVGLAMFLICYFNLSPQMFPEGSRTREAFTLFRYSLMLHPCNHWDKRFVIYSPSGNWHIKDILNTTDKIIQEAPRGEQHIFIMSESRECTSMMIACMLELRSLASGQRISAATFYHGDTSVFNPINKFLSSWNECDIFIYVSTDSSRRWPDRSAIDSGTRVVSPIRGKFSVMDDPLSPYDVSSGAVDKLINSSGDFELKESFFIPSGGCTRVYVRKTPSV